MPVPVWGTANDGEKVTVEFKEQTVSTVAAGGRWMVKLQPMKAAGPSVMKISGTNTIEIKNVQIGEVWVCSGQSNMDWPLRQTVGGEDACESSTDIGVSLFRVPNVKKSVPARDIAATWQNCNADTSARFSAVGYYFGRELRKSLGVPIGLIHCAWGGSPAQAWTSKVDIKANPQLSGYLDTSSTMYNGMVRPMQPFAIRGVIWYQGESNAGDAWYYRTLFPTMISCWRKDWGQGDFPFLFVQLAPYMKIVTEPTESNWAELREAQLMTTKTVPNTAMAVITDVGDENDIHPQQKEPVGSRLALAARAMVYGQKVEYRSPTYKSLKIDNNRAIVSFSDARGGLVLKGDRVTEFTICGPDHKFYNADATIKGNQVVVSSPSVAHPVAVRYGWANYPLVNLYSKANLPASPFRTDDFLITTAPKPE